MSWDEHTRPGLVVADSPYESARFGRSFARVTVGTAGPAEVTDALADRADDVLVVRFDASRRDVGAALARTGRAVLPAGTLTYWERPASLGTLVGPSAPLRVVGATESGAPTVAGLDLVVGDSFAAYGNHYSANPLLDPAAALAGYQEWARRSLDAPDHEVAFLLDGDDLIGAATVELTPEHVEILLAGLVASAQGRGAYRALLSWCVAAADRYGAPRVIISTQADNVRVQRTWARAGFVPYAAVETVHLVTPGLLGGGSAPAIADEAASAARPGSRLRSSREVRRSRL